MDLNQQVILPINITLATGAYTTQLWVGSEQVKVNVIIDTGSSTLAIDLNKYNPNNDQSLKTTTYAQSVVYGSGGWAGPVIHTQIELDHQLQIKLSDAPLTITADVQKNNFLKADGIWGLAYHHLNKAYDVSPYLKQQNPPLEATHPWPFTDEDTSSSVADLKKYLRQFPEHDISPLFTAFEQRNIIANQFALSTHRSIVYVPRTGMTQKELALEPLNQGQFVIGNDINNQSKLSMKVVHDAYYNTELIFCQVEGFSPHKAPPLQKEKVHSFFSNAIIDSGCSFLILQKDLYTYVKACLGQVNSEFVSILEAAQTAFNAGKIYLNPLLVLSEWPSIRLEFSGVGDQTIKLSIPPECYWQQHGKAPNNWVFMLMDQLPQWPNQTICGLPLINNYYCVFDRSNLQTSLIHWQEKPISTTV